MDPNTTHRDLYDLPNSQPNAKSRIAVADVYEKENEESTLDDILIRIRQFGPFQLIILLLICLAMLFSAIYSISYVFTASSVVHRYESQKGNRNNITNCKVHWGGSFSLADFNNICIV